jgi:hypothetical protein
MLGVLLIVGGLLLIAYGVNVLSLTIVSPTVIVVDWRTGQTIPNALVVIYSSVYTGDGRLLWIGWSGSTAKISYSGGYIYATAVAEVSDEEGHTCMYAGSVSCGGVPTTTLQVDVEQRYYPFSAPWWYVDAKNNDLTVKCDDKIMSRLSVSDVQSLLENGHKIYLWALLRIKQDSYRAGYTSPSGLQACRWFSTVEVTATPKSGYQFYGWILDVSVKTENPITVYMDNNHVLTAYFLIPISSGQSAAENPNPPYQQPTEPEQGQTLPNATSPNTTTLPTGATEVKPEIRTEYVLFGVVLCVAGVWIAVKKPSLKS